MLKSDNVPAILQLLIESLCELRINDIYQVMSEHPPEYDPQANGTAEAATVMWIGMFRTQKSGLERQLGAKIPARHPLTAWLAKWSGEVLNWDVKGVDGLTPYHRFRGKPFRTRLLCLGESCRYKLQATSL